MFASFWPICHCGKAMSARCPNCPQDPCLSEEDRAALLAESRALEEQQKEWVKIPGFSMLEALINNEISIAADEDEDGCTGDIVASIKLVNEMGHSTAVSKTKEGAIQALIQEVAKNLLDLADELETEEKEEENDQGSAEGCDDKHE